MTRLSLPILSAWSGRRNPPTRPVLPGQARHRLRPGAEPLETRDCPSGLAVAAEVNHLADGALLAHRDAHRHHPVPAIRRHGHDPGPTSPLTIYVKPGGKSGATAGKTAARPLGSLIAAIKRATPGTTIILAPGVYTENVFINAKSNLTIVGAPDQSSILAPPNNDAIRVIQSSNITIENVWFRSQGSQGRGLAVVGSWVTVQDIKTDGTQGDGVLVTGSAGQPAVFNATASQFDSVQTGSGLELDDGAVANINGCTFDKNGTSPAATQASNGLVLFGGAQAKITNSHFDGNTNAGLVASAQSQVTVQGSTFSSNQKGDGALFLNQATVNLVGNTFASNGVTRGEATGLNGVEFFVNYGGTAVVSGNVFQDNTANGIFIGSASGAIQVAGNTFNNNVVGIMMDSSTGSRINATIQGNTIEMPAPTSDDTYKGIIAIGTGVTATIGGPDTQGNSLENYGYSAINPNFGFFIFESGSPKLTNLANNRFTSGGRPVPEADAIHNG